MREDQEPRRAVAPDVAKARGDLDARSLVDEGDHVEHPRRDDAPVLLVRVVEQFAQSLLDLVDGRAVGAPGAGTPLDGPPAVFAEQQRVGLRRGPANPLRMSAAAREARARRSRSGRRSPLRVDLVVAREEHRVAAHRVTEQALVGLRRLRQERRVVEELHADGADHHPRSRNLRAETERDALVRLDA